MLWQWPSSSSQPTYRNIDNCTEEEEVLEQTLKPKAAEESGENLKRVWTAFKLLPTPLPVLPLSGHHDNRETRAEEIEKIYKQTWLSHLMKVFPEDQLMEKNLMQNFICTSRIETHSSANLSALGQKKVFSRRFLSLFKFYFFESRQQMIYLAQFQWLYLLYFFNHFMFGNFWFFFFNNCV